AAKIDLLFHESMTFVFTNRSVGDMDMFANDVRENVVTNYMENTYINRMETAFTNRMKTAFTNRTFEVLKKDLDIDAYLYKLTKLYGQNGIFELNMIGIRQIIITRAEYAEVFMFPSMSSSDQDKHMKHIMRSHNDGLLKYFDLENKGLVFNVTYNHWKFNRQIFSRPVRTASCSEETSRLINNLFEETMSYWIKLKKPDEDITVIDVTTWINRLFNDFNSVFITGRRSFAIEAHYRKFKKIDMTKEMSDVENFAECIVNFASDCQILFMPKILINFDQKQLGNDFLTSMIVTNTPYETCPQINVDPSLLRPMTNEEIRGVIFDSYLTTDTVRKNSYYGEV
ncbi:11755_t:CDS:2, partial [Dentiscutata heterogama]